MTNLAPALFFTLVVGLLATDISCATHDKSAHNISIAKRRILPSASKIRPGVIYEMPLHSEESWFYLDPNLAVSFYWHIYPSVALKPASIEEGGWPLQLERDCMNWMHASKKVNGWPSESASVGSVFVDGICSPIFEWSGISDGEFAREYVTSLRLAGGPVRAQIRISSADKTFSKLSAAALREALGRLLSSDEWKGLFKEI